MLVGSYIEHLWLQKIEDVAHSAVVNHQGAENGLFKFHGLRRDFAGNAQDILYSVVGDVFCLPIFGNRLVFHRLGSKVDY